MPKVHHCAVHTLGHSNTSKRGQQNRFLPYRRHPRDTALGLRSCSANYEPKFAATKKSCCVLKVLSLKTMMKGQLLRVFGWDGRLSRFGIPLNPTSAHLYLDVPTTKVDKVCSFSRPIPELLQRSGRGGDQILITKLQVILLYPSVKPSIKVITRSQGQTESLAEQREKQEIDLSRGRSLLDDLLSEHQRRRQFTSASWLLRVELFHAM